MGNQSFDAVKRFQEIRKSTNKIGDVGDTVTALVCTTGNVSKTYSIVTGIITGYRSDAGRIVLDESGKEHSLSSSDVRKYTPVVETQSVLNYRFSINDRVKLHKSLGGPVMGRIVARKSDALTYTVTFTTGHTADFPQEGLRKWDDSTDTDYRADTSQSDAHEDYRTAERFGELQRAEKGIGVYNHGESVAVLLGNSRECRIVYGKVYGTAYNNETGIKYHVVTREGDKHVGNDPSSLARI